MFTSDSQLICMKNPQVVEVAVYLPENVLFASGRLKGRIWFKLLAQSSGSSKRPEEESFGSKNQ